MRHKTHKPGSSGLGQVVISLIIAGMVTAGAGHKTIVTSPQPPTVCAQLQVFAGTS